MSKDISREYCAALYRRLSGRQGDRATGHNNTKAFLRTFGPVVISNALRRGGSLNLKEVDIEKLGVCNSKGRRLEVA